MTETEIDLILDRLVEENPDAILYDNYKMAIVGICRRKCMPPVIIYNHRKCIDILVQDMSEEEALEWFEFNTIGTWAGVNTPFLKTYGNLRVV